MPGITGIIPQFKSNSDWINLILPATITFFCEYLNVYLHFNQFGAICVNRFISAEL